MKSQYQQLRDILDATRYPVDPKHEADFRAILFSKKKPRRRNVLWFFLGCSGLLMAGYGVISSFSDAPAVERFFDSDSSQESAFRSAPSQESVTISTDQQEIESTDLESTEVENSGSGIENPGSGIQTETNDELKSHNTEVSNSTNASAHTRKSTSTNPLESFSHNTLSKKEKALTKQNENIKTSSTNDIASASLLNKSESQFTTISNSLETAPESEVISATEHNQISELTEDNQGTQVDQSETHQRTQWSHDEDLLNTPDASLSVNHRKVVETTPIIPSARRVHFNKVHYGVSAAWFPAGNLFMKSTLKTGYGYQIGGYATYRMTPQMQLRADAGFSKLDGGFTYIKVSTSQQYGFSVINQNHKLEVEKLFSAYASTEIGLKRGKNLFCFGLLGQYLYGARGDIESMEQGQIETPVITVSNDVWLSTKDMNKFSLQGTVGIRSHLTRRLQLAAIVRIPITHTVQSPKDNSLYEFQVKSHGISPQLSMSYQINQQ